MYFMRLISSFNLHKLSKITPAIKLKKDKTIKPVVRIAVGSLGTKPVSINVISIGKASNKADKKKNKEIIEKN